MPYQSGPVSLSMAATAPLLSPAPANAHAEVKACAHHVTSVAGGHGAAREFCDLLLVASGRYAGLLEAYA